MLFEFIQSHIQLIRYKNQISANINSTYIRVHTYIHTHTRAHTFVCILIPGCINFVNFLWEITVRARYKSDQWMYFLKNKSSASAVKTRECFEKKNITKINIVHAQSIYIL